MKKLIRYIVAIFFCFTIIVVCIPIASGKTITSDVAQNVASNFFKQNAGVQVNTLTLAYTEVASSGDSVYFVFNVNGNKGFVIVVADDAQSPVIGYSTEGAFIVPASHTNMDYWMKQRKNEIIANKAQHVQATLEISAQWATYINSKPVASRFETITPLLLKTLWDQPAPYNALCPYNTVTGCVATAMAQVMRYWMYPTKGTGHSSDYSPPYGILSADYDTTTYNWSNMPLGRDTSPNHNVALLMYQCGVSVDMQYSDSDSYAYVTTWDDPYSCAQISYTKYFGYNASTIQGLQRTNYSDSVWIALIENDIKAGRPVEYEANDTIYGSHTWVCDQFDNINYIHMNWGWSGYDDGYYSLNRLVANGYDFTDYEEIITGIEPPGTAGIPSPAPDKPIRIYPNPANTEFTVQGPASSKKVQYKLYNMLGEELKTGDIATDGNYFIQSIQVSDLEQGIYFITINSNQQCWSAKVEICNN